MVTAAFLVLTVTALVYSRYMLAGCLLALTALSTQFGVLIVPFAFYYVYGSRALKLTLTAFLVVVTAIFLPFAVTAANMSYNLVFFFLTSPQTQLLGQHIVSSPTLLGLKTTALVGTLLLLAIIAYSFLTGRAKDIRLVATGEVLSSILLTVAIAPNFFEAYLTPALALVLVYFAIGR
jgi:hypothetical protein